GSPALSLPAAACRPAVSARTCCGESTLVVLLVPAVGSSAEKPIRIRPPSRYFATISAGVATPAYLRLPAAEPALTLFASLPYAYGMSTWPTRPSSAMPATIAARSGRPLFGWPPPVGVAWPRAGAPQPAASTARTATAATRPGRGFMRPLNQAWATFGLAGSADPGEEGHRAAVAGVAVGLQLGVPGGAERLVEGVCQGVVPTGGGEDRAHPVLGEEDVAVRAGRGREQAAAGHVHV